MCGSAGFSFDFRLFQTPFQDWKFATFKRTILNSKEKANFSLYDVYKNRLG